MLGSIPTFVFSFALSQAVLLLFYHYTRGFYIIYSYLRVLLCYVVCVSQRASNYLVFICFSVLLSWCFNMTLCVFVYLSVCQDASLLLCAYVLLTLSQSASLSLFVRLFYPLSLSHCPSILFIVCVIQPHIRVHFV